MNWTLSQRIFAFFSTLVLLTVFFGVYDIKVMREMNHRMQSGHRQFVQVGNAARELKLSVLTLSNRISALAVQTDNVVVPGVDEFSLHSAQFAFNQVKNYFSGAASEIESLTQAYENWLLAFQQLHQASQKSQEAQELDSYRQQVSSSELVLLSRLSAITDFVDEEISALYALNKQNLEETLTNDVLIILFIAFVSMLFSWSLTKDVVRPIRELKNIIVRLAIGDSSGNVPNLHRSDELGDISRAIQELLGNLNAIAKLADEVSTGNYSAEITTRSDKDELSIALQRMTQNLSKTQAENNDNNWLQQGEVAVAQALQQGQSYASLGTNLLQTIAGYLDLSLASIYYYDAAKEPQPGHLQLAASYAYADSNQLPERIRMGEGLIGQAALEHKLLRLEQVPEEYFRIHSSLGDATPNNLLIVPFDYRGNLSGVLELGFVQAIDDRSVILLGLVRESIAMAFENLRAQLLLEEQLQALRKLTAEIKTSEMRTNQILDASLSAIINISTSGIIVSCNKRTAELFGYSNEELLGNNVNMLMPMAIAKQHDGYLDNYLSSGVAKIIGVGREVVAQRKNGTEFYAHLSVSEIRQNEKLSFLGTVTDITAQVALREESTRLLQKISLNEERTRTIIESSLAGIITITGKGIIESCNQTTEKLFGYRKDEMVGNNVKMLMPAPTAKEHDGYLRNYQQTGVAKIIGIGREVVARRKDGSEFHIHLSVAEMRLEGSLSYLGTIMDITQQVEQREKTHQANQELQATTEELETQQEELRISNEELNVRTKDLAQQKQALVITQNELQEQALQLQQSSRYKSEFLANMSHELRTPLNSLLILSKLLADNEDGNLSEDQVESANVIQESGTTLLSMINDILDLSKVESGHMPIHDDSILLADLQMFLSKRFDHMAESKGISFGINIAEQVPTCFICDFSKLSQILSNLISNALKFTHQGEVNLTISVEENAEQDTNGLHLLSFNVSDTGIGIAEEQYQSIFQAFHQADGTTSRKYGGTGLGLSIAKSFAKLLGGDIDLQSVPHKGSQFMLTLPLRLQFEEQPSEITEAQPALLAVAANSQAEIDNTNSIADDRDRLDPEKSLFLLIEDDQRFAKIIRDLCHQQQAQMLHAPDGETGLVMAKSYPVTGIILDYQLPGMNGSVVLEMLQQDANTRQIPVHLVSADENVFATQQEGAIGSISKPISTSELKSVLAKLRVSHSSITISMLVIEDDDAEASALIRLLEQEAIQVSRVKTGNEALSMLEQHLFSAIILDLDLPDISGTELLQQITQDNKAHPAIIVYTGKVLSDEEHIQVQHHANSVVIKSVRSLERLLDEVHLFIDHVETGHSHEQHGVEHEARHAELKDKTVLLVDDDMRITFSLAKVLGKKQLNVKIAPSGQVALKLLDEQAEIALVLMDIMMPQMDGYETIKRIRSQQRFKDLPIIALTANAMSGDKEKCLQAGANDYLAKPVDVDQLILQMQIWL